LSIAVVFLLFIPMIYPCVPPLPLKKGDLLRVIAPSGRLRETGSFLAGVEIWRQQGYRVQIDRDGTEGWGYLAGTDEQRRQSLLEAWQDPDCRGVLCVRGGYGGARLLEDWQWPEAAPKWLIGFSDITSLLWSLAQTGCAGVHGPVLTTLAAEPDWSQQRLFDWVAGRSLPPLVGETWVAGRVTGWLLPANLTVATHLLQTPRQLPLAGAILAIEDVGEAPYRIDRMLTQWRASGLLEKVKGIAIGRFSQCEPPSGIPSFTVTEVLRERLANLGIPIVAELPFGHDGANGVLPVGVAAELDGETGELRIL
jgi:muramoyltetrapeptide carboxypeptidase